MPSGFRYQLNGGINFSVPTSMLQPGELALARNCMYRQDSPQLVKALGRTVHGTMTESGEAVNGTGLSYVKFRNGEPFLLGAGGLTLLAAPLSGGGIGTFTGYSSGLSAVGRAEAVYFNGTDRVYISDGTNRMQVWDGSTTMRDGGGLTPTGVVTVDFNANSATGYVDNVAYSWLYTEYNSTTEVESPPSAIVRREATAASGSFQLTWGNTTTTNSGFDKIRLYRTQFGGGVFYRQAEFDFASEVEYYDGTTAGFSVGANTVTNEDIWGTDFITVDDIFLSTQPTAAMVGEPLIGNYMTLNGEIPIGSIMVMFENRLVIAGVDGFPQHIYYSEPEYPESFSPVNFIPEENGRGDPVTAMGVANDRLLVFLTNTIFRHNTLPSVTDPGFGLGFATRELVTDDHGCIAKRSVVNFGVGQPNNRLFYLSARGPMMTDGYVSTALHDDLDWSNRLYNIPAASQAVAINYPKYSQIRLFLPSAGSKTNDIALIYHYHPAHFKRGSVGKWTGPVHVRCADATVVHDTESETRMFVLDAGLSGKVYEEDSGLVDNQNNDATDGAIDWEWITGDYSFDEESGNKRVQRVFVNVVGTEEFDSTFTYAVNKRDSENPIHLSNISENEITTVGFGDTQVMPQKTRSYRGGVHQTGAHFRWHMKETAIANREIGTLELEIQPFGRQR